MRKDDRRTDPQPAFRRRCAKDDRLSGLHDFTEQPARALVKRLSFIRQSKALRSALDQSHAEVLFEFGDPARQRGLGTTGDAGSAAESAMGRDQIKVGQSLKIHLSVPYLGRIVSILASTERK